MAQAGNLSGESKATSLTETTFEDTKKDDIRSSLDQNKSAIEVGNTIVDDAATSGKEKQPPTESEEDMEYPHGVKLWVILGALCLAVFLVALDQTIISTAIPKITDHFNSIEDIGW
jgi:hypothetical protein